MTDERYQRGKIYKITDNNHTEMYIGSTIDTLGSRISNHRNKYRKYLQDKKTRIRSFDLFEKYGIDNCQIELLEEYPCNSKIELEKKEGEYIKNNKCVNKCIAGRSNKEYRQDNREKIAEYHRQYQQENKDKLNEKKRQYREENKEKFNERQRKYRLSKLS